MARVAASGHGRHVHTRFLHARYGEVIHACPNALPGMGRVHRIEPDLAYVRVVVEPDRHKTDDSPPLSAA